MLNKLLTEKEINLFIKKFDTTFDNKLSNYFNYSRVVSLAHFSLLAQTLNLNGDVGVVSGSSNEPELKFINVKSVSLLNFSENIKYDLDSKWDFDEKYDIVVCNQVLEHIFSPLQAFSNLLSITKPGGYIYNYTNHKLHTWRTLLLLIWISSAIFTKISYIKQD
jgi:SAM-dependent methyltransferase